MNVANIDDRGRRRRLTGSVVWLGVAAIATAAMTAARVRDAWYALLVVPFTHSGSDDLAFLGGEAVISLGTKLSVPGVSSVVDPLAVRNYWRERDLDVTSMDALRSAGVEVAGVVINRYPAENASVAEETNLRAIPKWGRVPVLCVVHHVHTAQFGVHFPGWLAGTGRML